MPPMIHNCSSVTGAPCLCHSWTKERKNGINLLIEPPMSHGLELGWLQMESRQGQARKFVIHNLLILVPCEQQVPNTRSPDLFRDSILLQSWRADCHGKDRAQKKKRHPQINIAQPIQLDAQWRKVGHLPNGRNGFALEHRKFKQLVWENPALFLPPGGIKLHLQQLNFQDLALVTDPTYIIPSG